MLFCTISLSAKPHGYEGKAWLSSATNALGCNPVRQPVKFLTLFGGAILTQKFCNFMQINNLNNENIEKCCVTIAHHFHSTFMPKL